MIANNIGMERGEAVKKEIYKTIFVGPLYGIFMLVVLYLSTSKNLILFYVIGLFFLILFFSLIIYAPYKMLKRHLHTIYSFNIENNYISFSTFPSMWGQPRKYKACISEFKIRKSIFRWYGKNTEKDGLILSIKGEEFYLVKDFFDDYDMVVDELNL